MTIGVAMTLLFALSCAGLIGFNVGSHITARELREESQWSEFRRQIGMDRPATWPGKLYDWEADSRAVELHR